MKLNKHALTTIVFAFCAVGTALAQGEAPVSPEVRPPLQVVVSVLADGTYKVGRTPIKLPDLPVAVRVLAGLPDKPAVIVAADKNIPYPQVVSALDACRDASLTEVFFSTTSPKAQK